MKQFRFWGRAALAARAALCLALALTVIFGCMGQAAFAEETGKTNSKVILRKNADKDSRALQTVPAGEDVTILSRNGNWYKVRYGSFTGYMMKQFVGGVKGGGADSGSKNTSNAKKVEALGSAPGIMRVGDENADVKKLQQALNILGYYDGKIDGKYGEGTTKAVKAYQKDKHLETDGYAGFDTVRSIFGSCRKTSLTKQPEPGSDSGSSKGGSSSSKSKYPTVSSVEAIGSAPAKTQKGDSGANVVKLQQALECLGYYDGPIDGSFGESTEAAVKRFQRKRNMKEDGIAGSSTIRVIFGENAKGDGSSSDESKKTKTENPDWYKDNMSRVIPKNARITIKDIRTGKTFEAVRWSGANHIDAEPRTAKDTAIMKSIYGGSWSWRRRPILVKYNGHVYAASMNGMPHGSSTIFSNSFDGVFCIHFKNSKTHGSNKVDPDHQSAITQASKASW